MYHVPIETSLNLTHPHLHFCQGRQNPTRTRAHQHSSCHRDAPPHRSPNPSRPVWTSAAAVHRLSEAATRPGRPRCAVWAVRFRHFQRQSPIRWEHVLPKEEFDETRLIGIRKDGGCGFAGGKRERTYRHSDPLPAVVLGARMCG